MDGPGHRIKKAREAMDLSQEQFGQLCGGWGQSRISSYERGINEPGLKDFETMATVTGRSVGWLQALEPEDSGNATGRRVRSLPVIGFVIATPDTDGFFDDMGFPPGGGEAYVPWGTNDPNAYAVRVKGDSMYPRYRPGEILIVEPSTAVLPGEDVIVRVKDGRKMVKRLLFKRANEIELGSINESHKPITISLENIESLQVVAGSVRRAEGE